MPATDTPVFDVVMNHLQLIKDIRYLQKHLPTNMRKRIAVGEFIYYRKMRACNLTDLFDYSVVDRCRWKLDVRWKVPARLVEKVPLVQRTKLPTGKEYRNVGLNWQAYIRRVRRTSRVAQKQLEKERKARLEARLLQQALATASSKAQPKPRVIEEKPRVIKDTKQRKKVKKAARVSMQAAARSGLPLERRAAAKARREEREKGNNPFPGLDPMYFRNLARKMAATSERKRQSEDSTSQQIAKKERKSEASSSSMRQ